MARGHLITLGFLSPGALWRAVPKLKADSTESQLYLGEFVLFYCLQFLIFSFYISLGWSTFPPPGLVCLAVVTKPAEKSHCLRDYHPRSRNRRNPILSYHHHSQPFCEWQEELAHLLSAPCIWKSPNSKSREEFAFEN